MKVFGNAKSANFSVATNYCYTTQDGCQVIETTWHYVTAWEGENVANLDLLTTGTDVHIVGRIRVRKRRRCTGQEVTDRDIVASKVELM